MLVWWRQAAEPVSSRNDIVRVDGLKLIYKGERAMLVDKTGREAWLPLSQIEDTDLGDKNDEGFVEIPRWLAESEELDYGDE